MRVWKLIFVGCVLCGCAPVVDLGEGDGGAGGAATAGGGGDLERSVRPVAPSSAEDSPKLCGPMLPADPSLRCYGDTQCDDSDPCTADRCYLADGTCCHAPIGNCHPG